MRQKATQVRCFHYQEEKRQNPYIGFLSYQHFRDGELYSDVIVNPKNGMTETENYECYPVPADVAQNGREEGFYPDTTVAYIRILWKEFEPKQGEYHCEVIENVLREAKAKGQTVMLRLMPHSTRACDDVPDWLKEMMPCPERPDGARVKDSPTDPAYLELFGKAIEKIAERFDDDPTLDVVDICLPGAWGEGHNLQLYSEEVLKQHVDVYTRCFKNTHLLGQVAAPELVKYANETRPVGWRGDGTGHGEHMQEIFPKAEAQIPEVWKKAPVSFESFYWLGEWYRKGWNIDEIIELTLKWHISTFNAKNFPIPYKWKDKIKFWNSKMGYHFVIDYFKTPSAASAGDELEVEWCIDNCGVAPIYHQIPFVIRLVNDEAAYTFDADVDIRKWLPGKNVNRRFIKLPENMKGGNYKLEIGIMDETVPMICFATDAADDGAYYIVGELTVSEEEPLDRIVSNGGNEMKELKIEELSMKQKIGMAMVGIMIKDDRWEGFEENARFTMDLIRNHSLGAVWVSPRLRNFDEVMAMIKETADYPILIFTDAESGIGGHMIGRHNAIGCTGSEEHAYIFGKVTAVTARQMGYNVVCNPVLDMKKGPSVGGGNVRSFGSNKYKVAKLAAAEARGMHDGGLLTVAKHYPSPTYARQIDSHMAEVSSENTVEELLDYHLYPYLELMKEDLLDGIMVGHGRLEKIDPVYPASLSKKVIDIIRNQGFDGFAITDSLEMMGIVAKFGSGDSKGMAIAAGIDLALPWNETKKCYDALCHCYDKGMLAEERINEAVRRVLEAQHKTLTPPKFTELTEEDLEKFYSINRDSVFARTDEGLSTGISRDGRHYFAVMVENGTEISDAGKVTVDTFSTQWQDPKKLMERLEELFPNSTAAAIDQFPSPNQNMKLLENSVDYDDVVFITFVEGKAYSGKERFTSRITSLVEALQVTNRISTVVHFGDPYALEDFEVHIPRIIIGCLSPDSVNCTVDVLAGDYPAKGVLTYDVKLK